MLLIIVGIILFVILIIYSFDFTKMREQNETLIQQNKEIIAILEEIKTNKQS